MQPSPNLHGLPMVTLQIVITENHLPGYSYPTITPWGTTISFRVPENAVPGCTVHLSVPRPASMPSSAPPPLQGRGSMLPPSHLQQQQLQQQLQQKLQQQLQQQRHQIEAQQLRTLVQQRCAAVPPAVQLARSQAHVERLNAAAQEGAARIASARAAPPSAPQGPATPPAAAPPGRLFLDDPSVTSTSDVDASNALEATDGTDVMAAWALCQVTDSTPMSLCWMPLALTSVGSSSDGFHIAL